MKKLTHESVVEQFQPSLVFASLLLMQMYITSVVRLRNAVGQGRSIYAENHQLFVWCTGSWKGSRRIRTRLFYPGTRAYSKKVG